MTDDWTKGHLNKPVIWSFYVWENYLGVILCSIVIISIILMPAKKLPISPSTPNFAALAAVPTRTSLDILIGGLCSACLWMSITCGSQCLISVIHGYFYGGPLACKLEAFFHISAILTQFFFDAAIAIRSYFVVMCHPRKVLPISWAWGIVILIWMICLGVTYSLSIVSDIYLMSAGTYCFFGFSSPGIAGWLVPGLGISLSIMVYCYVRIFNHVWKSKQQHLVRMSSVKSHVIKNQVPPVPTMAPPIMTESLHSTTSFAPLSSPRNNWIDLPPPPHPHPPAVDTAMTPTSNTLSTTTSSTNLIHTTWLMMAESELIVKVALRSVGFCLVLLLGWFFAAVATIVEFSQGETPEWLVTAVGFGGVTHSIVVPIIYAWENSFHRETFKIVGGWLICTRIRRSTDSPLSFSQYSSGEEAQSLGQKAAPVITGGGGGNGNRDVNMNPDQHKNGNTDKNGNLGESQLIVSSPPTISPSPATVSHPHAVMIPVSVDTPRSKTSRKAAAPLPVLASVRSKKQMYPLGLVRITSGPLGANGQWGSNGQWVAGGQWGANGQLATGGQWGTSVQFGTSMQLGTGEQFGTSVQLATRGQLGTAGQFGDPSLIPTMVSPPPSLLTVVHSG